MKTPALCCQVGLLVVFYLWIQVKYRCTWHTCRLYISWTFSSSSSSSRRFGKIFWGLSIFVEKWQQEKKTKNGSESRQLVSQERCWSLTKVLLRGFMFGCTQVEPSIQRLFARLPDVNHPHPFFSLFFFICFFCFDFLPSSRVGPSDNFPSMWVGRCGF